MYFADEDELEEPLLGRSSPGAQECEPSTSYGDADGAKGNGQHGSVALVPHSINRVDWEALWRVLWSRCCRSWNSVLGGLHGQFCSLLGHTAVPGPGICPARAPAPGTHVSSHACTVRREVRPHGVKGY